MTSAEQQKEATVVIRARRTELLDAPDVRHLAQPWTPLLFGRVNVVNVIEKATLAVTLINDKEETMGHAALYNYPNLPEVKPWEWESWMTSTYGSSYHSAVNTLFLHYFVAREEHAHLCAREILNTAFNIVPELLFIYLVVPRGVTLDNSLAGVFEPLSKTDIKNKISHYTVMVSHRKNHVPMLKARRARVEDTDDVMAIIGNQMSNLRKVYGDYFMAEVIAAQDEHMHCLVVESDGIPKGFMSISDDINYKILQDCFELDVFEGLLKPEHEVHLGSSSVFQLRSETLLKPELSKSASRSIYKTASGTQLSTSLQSRSATTSHASHMTLGMALGISRHRDNSEFSRKNAFSIQLFGMDEKHEMRSCDFLPYAFLLFSNLDYCIMLVNHLVPVFPLIQNFVRVTPRSTSTLPQELYIFHRSGLHDISVRKALMKDCVEVAGLVRNIQQKESLLNDLREYSLARRDPDGTEIQAFVAECQKQIVGVAVIRKEEDIDYIRAHYNIEDHIYFNHHRRDDHGHLHHFALNPIFSHFTKHFMKEILRLGDKTCLYYPIYPSYAARKIAKKHSLVCSLGCMVPVHARKQIRYNVDALGTNAPSDSVLAKREPYALSHINRKLTLDAKETINARIVVVGASDVAFSFLETMYSSPYMTFNNLVLVSTNGLPELPPDPVRDGLLPNSHCYTSEDLAKMSLRTWVNVVRGRMTSIDSRRKVIIVNYTYKVPYDHLLLCTGQQFKMPMPVQHGPAPSRLGEESSSGTTTTTTTESWDYQTVAQPKNLYLINDILDAAAAIKAIKKMSKRRTVVVYGCKIDAYCCIQTLLTLGFPGRYIAWVHAESTVPCFEDLEVVRTLAAALQEASVQVYAGDYRLYSLNDNPGFITDVITRCSFTLDDVHFLDLQCQAFFAYSRKQVDYTAFKAANDACLVYDGNLVIDAGFCTYDPSIHAAGPMTKFCRSYHVEGITHASFNSKEVGMELAQKMVRLLDGTLEPAKLSYGYDINTRLIPIYHRPRVLGARLPGGYHFLQVSKPASPDPLIRKDSVVADLGIDKKRELVTGMGGVPQGYMKVGIDQYQTVDHVLCLTKQDLPADHMISLYGIHQRILNNMVSRYDEGLIQDFYKYFSESWCLAIFHDRFPSIRDEIRDVLLSSPTGRMETIEERVRHLLDQNPSLDTGTRKWLTGMMRWSGSKRALETHLLSFLAYNYPELPMYARPGMLQ